MTTTPADLVLRQLRGLVTAAQADRQLLQRFAARREAAAFEALVNRHGPLVWGVCRRVLRNLHDAEDAFQATFLVLAQKAAAAGRRGSVGGWLYRVAYHTALKARQRAADRQRHERRASAAPPADPLADVTGRELVAVLDEELAQLSEKYRAPLVLCYLEGNTCDEAARHLGCSTRTLKRRLEQGRSRLRARLTRRGLALPAALLASAATASAVPAALASTAVEAGLRVIGGHAVASTAHAAADALAAGMLPTMTLTKLKGAGAVLLAAAILALGAFTLARPGPSPQLPAAAAERPPSDHRPAPAPREEPNTMTVAGRVLDADGRPVAGAEVAVVARGWDFAATEYQVLMKGSTDQEGRFRVRGPRRAAGAGLVFAGKPGYGLGQQSWSPQEDQQDTTLTLPPEQLLRGRLLDLQGQPAAGVKVAVMRVGSKAEAGLMTAPEGLPLWPAPATSDAAGRFTLARLPRNQEVILLVQEDRFGWQPLRLPPDNGDKEMIWTLSPARLLDGQVLHEDTGKPAANARLVVAPAGITGRTDRAGRFKLHLPAVDQRSLPPLLVYPKEGEPYLPVRQEVTWPRGAVKHEVVVKLPRGGLVRGRVSEAGSGRPVAGAGVQYVPQADNPNLRPNLLTGWQHVAASGTDGSFQVPVLPGPGCLLVSGPGRDFIPEEVGDRVLTDGKPGGVRLYADALVRLDPSPDSLPKEVTVALRRGVARRGQILGRGGEPVARVQMACGLLKTAVPSLFQVEVRNGLFSLNGCDPKREYPVYFLDPENGWGATVTVGPTGPPVSVQLAPCGRAVARFVDAEGNPLKEQPLRVLLHLVITPGPSSEEAHRTGTLAADEEFAENLDRRKDGTHPRTDAEGRFTFTGLIPGASYRLSAVERSGPVLKKEFRAQSAKTLELGDIPLRPR